MNPAQTAVFREPPTEKQKAYIRDLAKRLQVVINLDKVTDRAQASRVIRSLTTAVRREGGGGAPPSSLDPWLDKVIQADCTRALGNLPSGGVNLMVTDPPYLVSYRSRDGRSIENDGPGDGRVIELAMKEAYRVLKPDSFGVCFYGWSRSEEFARAWRLAGFRVVGHFVWTKKYASGRGVTKRRHEQACLLAKGEPKAKRQIEDVLPWRYTGNRLHPMEKPVSALTPLIEAFSAPRDIVLDPFAGSGSTAMAAQKLGRHFIAIELSKEYAWTAARRLRVGMVGKTGCREVKFHPAETRALHSLLRQGGHLQGNGQEEEPRLPLR